MIIKAGSIIILMLIRILRKVPILQPRKSRMAPMVQYYLLVATLVIAIISPYINAQPPPAEATIEKERVPRHLFFKSGANEAGPPQRRFFGTIFNVILEQINDTKSAYNQISDLVSNQFADENAVTSTPDPSNNGTTPTPKITRTEFLRILDRNLKGLSRLRDLEWREARKDSAANLKAYKDEIFRAKKSRSIR